MLIDILTFWFQFMYTCIIYISFRISPTRSDTNINKDNTSLFYIATEIKLGTVGRSRTPTFSYKRKRLCAVQCAILSDYKWIRWHQHLTTNINWSFLILTLRRQHSCLYIMPIYRSTTLFLFPSANIKSSQVWDTSCIHTAHYWGRLFGWAGTKCLKAVTIQYLPSRPSSSI